MTPADRITAEANARVVGWPSVSPGDLSAVPPETAVITPRAGCAELSWRGVDRRFGDVFEALAETDALGIPRDRVRVQRFPSTAIACAESPVLRVF